jgi:hypothetical protein
VPFLRCYVLWKWVLVVSVEVERHVTALWGPGMDGGSEAFTAGLVAQPGVRVSTMLKRLQSQARETVTSGMIRKVVGVYFGFSHKRHT